MSVDLDFNYIATLDRERMLEDRPKCEDAILDLAQKKKVKVQQSAETFAGRKIYCTYNSTLGTKDRIEIDLHYLFRLPLGPPKQKAIWQPGGIVRPRIMMVSLAELIIGKLLAFFDRGAIRDIWDVAGFPRLRRR
ncbi:MAG: nucleotidyl transferase AbiEii/AbiGii toxin family protein [Anaerolineales bacterium]